MIKVENIEVMNLPSAFKGMRNPLESWNKSDSGYKSAGDSRMEYYAVGPKDLTLALQLVNAGSDHSKFMRQILVSMDITAPSYWWQQEATYKISTVENSTSKMHKIGTRHLNMSDFGWDYMTSYRESTLQHLNWLIDKWNDAKKHGLTEEANRWWRELLQDTPDSYIYLRAVTLNYAVLRNMYHSRKSHKLIEWREFCKIIEELPYSELITT